MGEPRLVFRRSVVHALRAWMETSLSANHLKFIKKRFAVVDIPVRVSLSLSICLTASLLFFTILYSRYGLDFTDEGFQLVWISDPSRYELLIPVSFFGFVYHPIYQFLGGDTVVLRYINVFLTYGGACLLSAVILLQLCERGSVKVSNFLVLSMGMATTSLAYFSLWWIVTPSYNSLALQGMLLTFVGLVTTASKDSRIESLGWTCIGIGGGIVFLAKPSTAALLAPAVLSCQVASGRHSFKMIILAIGSAIAVLLSSVPMIGWRLSDFVERISYSVQLLKLLGSGQEFSKIFRVDLIGATFPEKAAMTAIGVALLTSFWAVRWPKARIVIFAASSSLAIFSIAYLCWPAPPLVGVRGVVIIAIPAAAAITTMLFCREQFGEFCRLLPLATLLFAAPHIYAFGTNGDYWTHGSAAMLFWGLSGVVLLFPLIGRLASFEDLLSIVILMQFVTAGLLVQAVAGPYRQESFDRSSFVPWDLRGRGEVMISKETRDYLARARAGAREAGLLPGDPMIDLTGRSPGLLYDLQVLSLGQPWQVGGYPGSNALAMASLRNETCTALSRAWLLAELNGPRRLSSEDVVRSFGASLQTDYHVTGSFETSAYAGGYAKRFTQQLLKPVRDVRSATEACEFARKDWRRGGKDRSPL